MIFIEAFRRDIGLKSETLTGALTLGIRVTSEPFRLCRQMFPE
jgi:hypothetical protein